MVDADGNKHCPRCQKNKPAATDFHRQRAGSDGYGGYCKACARLTMKEWTHAHPDEVRARDRIRNTDPKRLAKSLASLREYGEKNFEAMRRRRATWKTRNPERAREIAHKRNSSIAGKAYHAAYNARPERRVHDRLRAHNRRLRCRADAGLSQTDWNHILDVFGHRCAYCQKGDVKMTIDHFLPLALGGKHLPSNIVPACGSCNSRKNDADPFTWMERRGLDSDLVVARLCETRHAA